MLILNLVLIALTITLEPIPLTAFIVIVVSANGVRKGAAFIFGWMISLAAVITITVLVTGNKPPAPNTAPSVAAVVVKLIAGLLLLWVALQRRRHLGQPKKEKKTPKWQARVDGMSLWYAFALGPLVQPWGLIGVGVAVILEAKLSSLASYLIVLGFAILASSSIIVLELLFTFRPEQAARTVASIRQWISEHTDQVIVLGSLALGLWLVGTSIAYLA